MVHQSRSGRWAAGDRWCPRLGTLLESLLWWPSPSGLSSGPPGSHCHHAALRSPQCGPSWGSLHHFPAYNELWPCWRQRGETVSFHSTIIWGHLECRPINYIKQKRKFWSNQSLTLNICYRIAQALCHMPVVWGGVFVTCSSDLDLICLWHLLRVLLERHSAAQMKNTSVNWLVPVGKHILKGHTQILY